MGLQEQFTEDLEIFFDLDEFSTMHVIEGRTLRLVIDNDQAQRNSLQCPGGMYDGDMLVFARTEDLVGMRILPESKLVMDMRPYTVVGVVEQAGITQLTLLGR